MNNIDLKNALITGGSGMVGSNMNFGYKPSSDEMNVCFKDSIEKYINKMSSISCIIHLASINLRESETDNLKAIDVNINGTSNMLFFSMKYNIPFILFSTGAVFSSLNKNIKFDENFITCPNSVYGSTKSAAEKIAILYEKTIIIRTGWLFGGNQKTHYKFVENVINNFLTNTEIKASNDFYGSPTYVLDVIKKMKELIYNVKYGIHHIVNDGIANGNDIACEIADILSMEQKLINSINCYKIPNSGPNRSNTEILETIYTFNKMRSWKDALKEYCEKYIGEKKYNKIEKINNYKWQNRETCRLCNNYNLNIFYKLQPTPPANHFVSEPIKQELIPLDIAICLNCKHIQLIQKIEPSFLYSNYFYVSSTSETMIQHLQKSVGEFVEELNISKNDYILEIGANDGVCIKYLLDNGFKNIVGIDPAENIKNRNSLPIICDFFGSNIINKLHQEFKPFKLIYAFHCCAHIEDIQDIFKTIYNILDDEGTFVMEVGYFYDVFQNMLFDTIYHEHIDYHTVTAMKAFSDKNNLLLYKIKRNNIQGGSIQFFMCKNNNYKNIDCSVKSMIENEKNINLHCYNNLSNWKINIINCGKDINYILNAFKSYGKKIVGYGASAKSTTMLYEYKISNKLIDYIIDDNIYKQDYYSPGLHIPIKSSYILNIDKIDYIIILSCNFTEEIIKKLEINRKNGLRIIIPFPYIKII